MDTRILITGGQSFLGAWTARLLLEEGTPFLLLDPAPTNSVLAQVIDPEPLRSIPRVFGSLFDPLFLRRVIEERGITAAIHLAGIDDPTFRGSAERARRARNEGLASLLEGAARSLGLAAAVVYASTDPSAQEEPARRAAAEQGVGSLGVRLPPAYGAGGEAGPCGAFTRAIRAAVLARRFTIPFSGAMEVAYVEDAARALIAASREPRREAAAWPLGGEAVEVAEFIRGIETVLPEAAGKISSAGEERSVEFALEESIDIARSPFEDLSRTAFLEGIRRTAAIYRALAEEGRLQDAGDGS